MVGVARIELATPAMSTPATHANLRFVGLFGREMHRLPNNTMFRQAFEFRLSQSTTAGSSACPNGASVMFVMGAKRTSESIPEATSVVGLWPDIA